MTAFVYALALLFTSIALLIIASSTNRMVKMLDRALKVKKGKR